MLKLLLVLTLFCAAVGQVYPQEDSLTANKLRYDSISELEQVTFDKNQLESYKTDKAFDYLNKVERDSWWTRFKRWLSHKYQNFLYWLFGDYEANAILMFIFSILPYVLLVLLLGMTTYLFIRLNPGPAMAGTSEKPEVFLSEEEKIIQSRNIDEYIDEAVANRQYRLAVRYHYLKNLKKLDEMGIIAYQFQKTNEDYYSEIKAETIKEQFRKITRFYNFIWYGDFKVSESDFKLAEKEFLKMDKVLSSKNNE